MTRHELLSLANSKLTLSFVLLRPNRPERCGFELLLEEDQENGHTDLLPLRQGVAAARTHEEELLNVDSKLLAGPGA